MEREMGLIKQCIGVDSIDIGVDKYGDHYHGLTPIERNIVRQELCKFVDMGLLKQTKKGFALDVCFFVKHFILEIEKHENSQR